MLRMLLLFVCFSVLGVTVAQNGTATSGEIIISNAVYTLTWLPDEVVVDYSDERETKIIYAMRFHEGVYIIGPGFEEPIEGPGDTITWREFKEDDKIVTYTVNAQGEIEITE